MEKKYFSTESVTEGHPDKVCDRISDSVIDKILAAKQIKKSVPIIIFDFSQKFQNFRFHHFSLSCTVMATQTTVTI